MPNPSPNLSRLAFRQLADGETRSALPPPGLLATCLGACPEGQPEKASDDPYARAGQPNVNADAPILHPAHVVNALILRTPYSRIKRNGSVVEGTKVHEHE